MAVKTEEPGTTFEPDDSGSSSSPDRKLVTETLESLFRPEPSSVQSEVGKQSLSYSQQESLSPVLPTNGIAPATPVICPSLGRDSSREEGDDEDKVLDKVELSATKTCDKGDNYVAAVDKLTPNTAIVTTIPNDKSDEVASSVSGELTVFSGRFFYFMHLLHFLSPSKNYFKWIITAVTCLLTFGKLPV